MSIVKRAKKIPLPPEISSIKMTAKYVVVDLLLNHPRKIFIYTIGTTAQIRDIEGALYTKNLYTYKRLEDYISKLKKIYTLRGSIKLDVIDGTIKSKGAK